MLPGFDSMWFLYACVWRCRMSVCSEDGGQWINQFYGFRCYKWSLGQFLRPRWDVKRVSWKPKLQFSDLNFMEQKHLSDLGLLQEISRLRLLCVAIFISLWHKDLVAHKSWMITQLSPPQLIGLGSNVVLFFRGRCGVCSYVLSFVF